MDEKTMDKMDGVYVAPLKRATKVSGTIESRKVISVNVIDYNLNFFLVVRSWDDGSVESKTVEKHKALNNEWGIIA